MRLCSLLIIYSLYTYLPVLADNKRFNSEFSLKDDTEDNGTNSTNEESEFFALILTSDSNIPEKLIKFISNGIEEYEHISVQNINQDPATINIFKDKDYLNIYLICMGYKNGVIDLEKLTPELKDNIMKLKDDFIYRLPVHSQSIENMSQKDMESLLYEYEIQKNKKEEKNSKDSKDKKKQNPKLMRNWQKRLKSKRKKSQSRKMPKQNILDKINSNVPTPVFIFLISMFISVIGYTLFVLNSYRLKERKSVEENKKKALTKYLKKLKLGNKMWK